MVTAKVLDKGFVTLVDVMGDDKRIVDAARISFASKRDTFDKTDVALLRYLMRNKHWSPFEMVQFTFKMKMPIFTARQFIRHRTAKVNEISARYTELPADYYIPELSRMNLQSKNNKQGSSDEVVEDAVAMQELIKEHCDESFTLYQGLIGEGLAKELSRMVLPLNTYTEWFYTIDLRNLFNLLWLRMDGHAQSEARDYANAMHALITEYVPHSLEAFEEYMLEGMTLSKTEVSALSDLVNNMEVSDSKEYKKDSAPSLGKREWAELKQKLIRLGVQIDN